jgi:hypothetical protein
MAKLKLLIIIKRNHRRNLPVLIFRLAQCSQSTTAGCGFDFNKEAALEADGDLGFDKAEVEKDVIDLESRRLGIFWYWHDFKVWNL